MFVSCHFFVFKKVSSVPDFTILRLFAALFPYLQAMTIFAFNNEQFNSKTLREVLSLGPTYVVMKFIESMFLWLLFSPKVLLIYQD